MNGLILAFPSHQDGAAEVGTADQAKGASEKVSDKPWKCKMCLLVFSPKCPKGSEPIHYSQVAASDFFPYQCVER